MEHITITSSRDYYLIKQGNYGIHNLMDYYNTRSIGIFELYVKEGGDFVYKGSMSEFFLNGKDIKTGYTSEEIHKIHNSSNYVLSRIKKCLKLNKTINIEGKCIIVYEQRDNYNVFYRYLSIIEYYWNSFMDKRVNIGYKYFKLIYNNEIYSLYEVNLHINGKYILDYEPQELSQIVKSKKYTIGPEKIIDQTSEPVTKTPEKFSLEDCDCRLNGNSLLVKTKTYFRTYPLTINPPEDDYYLCEDEIFKTVISLSKPKKFVVDRDDPNCIDIIKALVKYEIPIMVN